jgi:tRNA (cytosine34-C5)-methyltransferase
MDRGASQARPDAGVAKLGKRRARNWEESGAGLGSGKRRARSVGVAAGRGEGPAERSVGPSLVGADSSIGVVSRREAQVETRLWRKFDRGGSCSNASFAHYYQSQLGLSGADWSDLTSSLSRELCVTFRVNRGRFPLFSSALERRLCGEFRFQGTFKSVGGRVLSSDDVWRRVPWLRDAYQLGVDRRGLSRKCVALRPLSDCVSLEARLGHLARQGVASMVPALVLRPLASDVVLDLCGAPGSKSEQLLQMMGEGAAGCVVVNDSDPKRVGAVLSRLRQVPSRSLAVTCLRGEDLYRRLGAGVFDGCIADVPCTGDGTIRKFPSLWRLWRADRAVLLHPLQLQLAMSAASLLKVGGRLVYSTCSINPIEDEAVVAALLARARGALRLVSFALPGFKTRAGLHWWSADEHLLLGEMEDPKMEDPERRGDDDDDEESGDDDESGDDAILSDDERDYELSRATKHHEQLDNPKQQHRSGRSRPRSRAVVTASMRAPSAQAAREMQLDRCARILQHDNDTEGFFVALLEKVSPWEMGSAQADELCAQSASKVLKSVGFNPKLAVASSSETERGVALSAALRGKLRAELGCSDALLESGCVQVERRGAAQVSVSLLSPALAQIVSQGEWAKRGVPLLQAGVEVATAPAAFERERDTVPRSLGRLRPQSAGALELLAALARDGPLPSVALETSSRGMLHVLRLAIDGAHSVDMHAEAEPEQRATQKEMIVSTKTWLAQLREGGEGALAESLDRAPIECALFVALRNDDHDDEAEESTALALPNHPVDEQVRNRMRAEKVDTRKEEPESDTHKRQDHEKKHKDQHKAARLSVAERRRVKKQRDRAAAVALPATEAQDKQPQEVKAEEAQVQPPRTTAAQVDMFATTPARPIYAAVIVITKLSQSLLRVDTDWDRVSSYAAMLEAILTPSSKTRH